MSARNTKRTKSEVEEIMSKPVRMDGQGEDPVVQALLSDDFVQGSNVNALEIAANLQQLIRGVSVMNDNFSDQLQRMNRRMDEMDKAAEKWEKDRAAFIEEVIAKAKPSDKEIANGLEVHRNALTQARAEAASDRLRFQESIRTMPTETVLSPGELVTVMEQGRPVNKFMNEVVRVKNMQWIIPVGVPTEVPKVVAEILRQRRNNEEEQRARQGLLAKNLESSKLDAEWKKLNSTFHSSTDTVPVA